MLTKAGVPWEIATQLSPAELLGYVVATGEIDGATFNWSSMEWAKT